MELWIIEVRFSKIQGAGFLTDWGVLKYVDWRQKTCNTEFYKFYKANVFESKRLNLFVVLNSG